MSDLQIEVTDGLDFDLGMDGNDLATDAGLQTAVIVSLFTDARVLPEELPDGHTDRRGYWGDVTDPSDATGSKLWTLAREKSLNAVVTRAEEYAHAALRWMLEDGVASRIEVSARLETREILGIDVKIQRKQGGDVALRYAYNWQEQIAQVR